MGRTLTLKELKVKYIKAFIEQANGEELDRIFKACADVPIPYSIPFSDNPELIKYNPIATCNSGNGECKNI